MCFGSYHSPIIIVIIIIIITISITTITIIITISITTITIITIIITTSINQLFLSLGFMAYYPRATNIDRCVGFELNSTMVGVACADIPSGVGYLPKPIITTPLPPPQPCTVPPWGNKVSAWVWLVGCLCVCDVFVLIVLIQTSLPLSIHANTEPNFHHQDDSL